MSTQKHIKEYLKQLDRQYATDKAGEHSYRPAMQVLLEKMIPKSQAINEPKPTTFGAPDFEVAIYDVPVGHVEAKDIDVSLDDGKNLEQVARYAEHSGNIIYTDYLNFRLIRNGEQVAKARIAEVQAGKIKSLPENFADLADLIGNFATYKGKTIKSAADLAKRMAAKARMLAKVIADALPADADEVGAKVSEENADLHGQLQAFRKHLIHDIKAADFADIYAQTIAYGMFAARLHDLSSESFTREKAAKLIPTTNPFLRKFFQQIAGYDLDKRIAWIVDDLADLFRATDVGELMKDHGKKTERTDPVIHFYETFLGEYDSNKRISRGVYYTPEPVVDFIVRAVDDILRNEFALADGIASKTKTTVTVEAQGKKLSREIHKVQILDPATGTGTFLAAIVKHISEKYYAEQKGIWPGYVKEHLVPRLNGFEVLMASYAMAHIKLDMVLRENGGELSGNRVNVFLTNTLEEHHTDTGTLFAQWLSNEAEEANRIKRDTPVMVVIGNPPYAVSSSNKGDWINGLIADYKKDLNERKLNLDDDYIKFIRYGEYLVNKTGEGILAYISNNSFLDGVTHRQMRKHLLETFDQIYILNLHGNARIKETAPDGSVDKNVFDIMTGVSINLFVKLKNKNKQHSRRDRSRPVPTKAIDNNAELASVFHHDLYGERKSKYDFLWANDFKQVQFQKLTLQAPQYFFVPKNYELQAEYENGFSVNDLFTNQNSGIETKCDELAIQFTQKELETVINNFLSLEISQLKEKYSNKKDSSGWNFADAKADLLRKEFQYANMLYRPFDIRKTVFTQKSSGFIGRSRTKTMHHFIAGDNVGLTIGRQGQVVGDIPWCLTFIVRNITDINLYYRGGNVVCPLYLYPKQQPLKDQQIKDQQTEDQQTEDQPTRQPNLDKTIIKTIANGLGLRFTPEKETDNKTFAPIDLLDYIYAVLHSPTYREKYKEFLKTDFPRVPYPTDKKQFHQLVALGGQLRTLHLMESNDPQHPHHQLPRNRRQHHHQTRI